MQMGGFQGSISLLILLVFISKSSTFVYQSSGLRKILTINYCTQYVLIERNSIGLRKEFRWDSNETVQSSFRAKSLDRAYLSTTLKQFLLNCFIPSGSLSQGYYRYTLWRLAQRFVSATSSVFGSQALLLALGFKRNTIGLAAATTWVLKDALGKVSRIIWASNNGRKFDGDAKKWRFRSSILFALGNGLEILTYVWPSAFLVIAAIANALKQMAMLTSSSTRNAIYKSFGENIGDITAKGEAQIAVIDILGMGLGIIMSRSLGTSPAKLASAFAVMSVLDILCIFKEIKSVVFHVLNFERAHIIIKSLLNNLAESSSLSSRVEVLTPQAVSDVESIFLEGCIGEGLLRTWSSLEVDTTVLLRSLQLRSVGRSRNGNQPGEDDEEDTEVQDEVVVTASARLIRGPLGWLATRLGLWYGGTVFVRSLSLPNGDKVAVAMTPQILVGVAASQYDIFRALVTAHKIVYDFNAISSPARMVDCYRREMDNVDDRGDDEVEVLASVGLGLDNISSMVKCAWEYERAQKSRVRSALGAAGWELNRFLFGSPRMRVEWPQNLPSYIN